MTRRELKESERALIVAALRERAMSMRQVASAWDPTEGNIPKALGAGAHAKQVSDDLLAKAHDADRLASELASLAPGQLVIDTKKGST